MLNKAGVLAKNIFGQLRRKRLRYWLIVAILILLGMRIGDSLEENEALIGWRYSISQWTQQKFTARRAYPERTVVVLIGDEEYWKGELASRAPIKRSYLAKLVRALDAADPAVIAIDFDLSSPVPDGTLLDHPDYQAETSEFLETVKTVSSKSNRTIVLAKTLGSDDEGNYFLESDIYDGFDFGGGRVRKGYIALPYDIRKVPLSIQLESGGQTDSFAGAIVRAYNKSALQRTPGTGALPPFGTYLKAEDFQAVSASEILNAGADDLRETLSHKIVILGGSWHKLAFDRGSQVDTYLTPVGWIGGVFIHANYVEALLDLRTYGSWTESILIGVEVLAGLGVALIFFVDVKRWWMKAGVLLILILGLFAFSFLSWTILGLFFDCFIPIVLLFGKFGVEQVLHWRSEAREHEMQEEKAR